MNADRLPPIPEADWTGEQREHAREIIEGPRGGLIAPFVPLMRSPELMTHAQRMGEYLRYRSALGQRLTELAILVVARLWSQQVEWAFHAPLAARAGIADGAIEAIAQGRRPDGMSEDEALVYDFSIELQRNRALSDRTWAAAIARFGERGVVDLIGINGYYSLLSMVMNAARTPPPPTSAAPLPDLK